MPDAVELVANLTGALIASIGDSSEDFGLEELITVSLGPFLAALGEVRGKQVLASVTAAVKRVNEIKYDVQHGDQNLSDTLGNALLAEMSVSCAQCGARERSTNDSGPPLRLLKCARCKQVRYCSQACQKKQWPAHRKSCRPTTEAAKDR